MVNTPICAVEPAKNACLLNTSIPRPSRKLIAAAKKAGLPDTVRSLRYMRHEFEKFSWNPCLFCPPNGEQPTIQARQAVAEAKQHLSQDCAAFEALDVEPDVLMRIRPGQKPEVSVYDAFSLFAVMFSFIHLNPARYVEASSLHSEMQEVRTNVARVLDAIEKALPAVRA